MSLFLPDHQPLSRSASQENGDGPGICLGDGQAEAPGVPAESGRSGTTAGTAEARNRVASSSPPYILTLTLTSPLSNRFRFCNGGRGR